MNKVGFWIVILLSCAAGWGFAYYMFWFVWYPSWVLRALEAMGYK